MDYLVSPVENKVDGWGPSSSSRWMGVSGRAGDMDRRSRRRDWRQIIARDVVSCCPKPIQFIAVEREVANFNADDNGNSK